MKKPIFNTAVAVAVAIAAVFCIGCGSGGGGSGSNKPASLTGQWVDVNPKPEDSEEFELLSDGTAMFKNGDLSVSGTWSVVDKRFVVTVTMGGTNMSEAYNYNVSGYELTLVNDKGDTSTCVKKENLGEFKEKQAKIKEEAAKFIDSRDGKIYKKITIGSQTWLKGNLNYAAEYSVCYENSEDSCAKYGRLYGLETAKTSCPAGFHLPSNEEWTALENFVGGSKTAGKKLKSTSGWNKNGNGTDEFEFSALPGGSKYEDQFYRVGERAYWWTATEGVGNLYGYFKMMEFDKNGIINWNDDEGTFMFSVRCVQD